MGCTASKADDTAAPRYAPSVKLPPLMAGPVILPSENQPPLLSPAQQQLVRSTWAVMETDMAVIAKQLFLCIFDQDPSVKNLFPFRDVWGDELTAHPQFIAHTMRFMAVIQGAVRDLENLEESFAPAMISLGARHTKIGGFTPELFALFKSSMMVIWGQHLRGTMTPEINQAWVLLLDFTVRKLQQGYFGQAKMEEIINKATDTRVASVTNVTTKMAPQADGNIKGIMSPA